MDLTTALQTLQSDMRNMIATLPRKAGAIVLGHSEKAWRDQGFTDSVFAPWEPRKKVDAGRAILVKSGHLRRSLKILSVSADTVTVGTTGIPYAQVHNEGFSGSVSVKAHTRAKFAKVQGVHTIQSGKNAGKTMKTTYKTKVGQHDVAGHSRTMVMPQRKFLGTSAQQSQAVKQMILDNFAKLLKK